MSIGNERTVDAKSGVDSLVLPSPAAAKSVDGNVRDRLKSSIGWLAEEFDNLNVDPEHLNAWHARPVDFGFYFDLASAVHHTPDSTNTDENSAISARLSSSIANADPAGDEPQRLVVKTLGPEHYDKLEKSCLVRWFDLEPENSMALLPLDESEFEAASKKLGRAVGFLKQTAPEFCGELEALTTEIIFAKPGPEAKMNFGGASSFVLWGALALNAHAHSQWWEYLPRLVHEYSHNLLFGLAADGELVLNAPTEMYPSPLRQTARPIDGIYHACYVSAREVLAMDAILASMADLESGEEAQTVAQYCSTVAGRSSEAYLDCLAVLEEHARLTDLGKRILDDLAAAMSAR